MTHLKENHSEYIAAIDLGSNSFHMIVGRLVNNQLSIIDRLRESVRLGAGLQADGTLSQEARQRALDCLARFGQRVSSFPQGAVRAVGTNTLRKAKKSNDFLEEAGSLLGHPIDIISGVEEARLIHLGVINNFDLASERHLVIDIGGGSTEVITGESKTPLYLESLYMGCVSYSQKYFKDGVDELKWLRALTAAKLEVYPVASRYFNLGWKKVIGTSGTIKAIEKIAVANGWCKEGISLEALKNLRAFLCDSNNLRPYALPGLSKEREPVISGGVVVLEAIFESLKIKQLKVSDYSLREGALYDLVGRITHDDLRDVTVKNMMDRYKCESDQAERVTSTVRALFNIARGSCHLKSGKDDMMLKWAAQLHELGLTVAHSQYHKHGAYITEYADMAGFTRTEQKILSILIRNHRRKISTSSFTSLSRKAKERVICMVLILRLAVLLNRNRNDIELPYIDFVFDKSLLTIVFPAGWLASYPLTRADLEQEKKYLAALKVELTIAEDSGNLNRP